MAAVVVVERARRARRASCRSACEFGVACKEGVSIAHLRRLEELGVDPKEAAAWAHSFGNKAERKKGRWPWLAAVREERVEARVAEEEEEEGVGERESERAREPASKRARQSTDTPRQ